MKLSDLSLADLKAAGEYVEKLKTERIQDLKSQGISSEDDRAYKSWNKLAFDIRNNLFSRLIKLRSKD
jgi:hypothetical protein